MSDVGTLKALYCLKSRSTTPHRYERRIRDEGISEVGSRWRFCTYCWVCACCGSVVEPLEDREELDPITEDWEPRHRRSVRIPVVGRRLDVDVRAGAEWYWAPAGINLSMSGILVEAFPADTPELESGAELRVTLRFERHLVDLMAQVRRRERRQYGMAFLPSTDSEVSLKPDPLQLLVATLEQRWLSTRSP